MALSVEAVSRSGAGSWMGQAERVSVPLIDGEMGVLPGRAPVLALLGRGKVRITPVDGAAEVIIAVNGGFCSVDHDVVTVAADLSGEEAESAAAIGVDQMLAEAEELMPAGDGFED
ncbi:F-ATPase epsilon subunit [Actinomyces bovis]|uniref:ATP synthase epsilon chain n=1 Tax=Actinomyces bovis TaxID=1658 RepID=A0ABY1VLK3_9ACTO|nr:F0F1 ATP synthase subunit epsilon [Actinomyces bovis]SPT52794.1 F-ATPase epsilon subunit [Actinomyces bovis]VEG54830.1 F-ATPase epsilon subunit [Actinomyces israelii]